MHPRAVAAHRNIERRPQRSWWIVGLIALPLFIASATAFAVFASEAAAHPVGPAMLLGAGVPAAGVTIAVLVVRDAVMSGMPYALMAAAVLVLALGAALTLHRTLELGRRARA